MAVLKCTGMQHTNRPRACRGRAARNADRERVWAVRKGGRGVRRRARDERGAVEGALVRPGHARHPTASTCTQTTIDQLHKTK